MTGDDVVTWLASVFPGAHLSVDSSRPTVVSALDGMPVVVTAGFSSVDTGLVVEDDRATEVRCEIVCRANVPVQVLGAAVVEAAHMVETLRVPAQPGVLLDGLLERVALPDGATVRHGLLREPELFERGTPLYTEPGRLTLLLELVALTDDEFAIASDRGCPALATRLRRRGVRVADWGRDA
ncbi:Suppressor of fused protein (SUFU) [Corynebacterium capitovis DSM 44611]|uniref:suppressor of fused domain protein n=1 Tax=Corynebacterium capitovis TaxID=131081 RepID=UPI00037A31FB|nr:suppressor of fused domain protein [Corynebacterium capitovis]WKD56686.1 Suppressor of fused protein (SUFU) [Corynebacterium capitovis DSM 44611]